MHYIFSSDLRICLLDRYSKMNKSTVLSIALLVSVCLLGFLLLDYKEEVPEVLKKKEALLQDTLKNNFQSVGIEFPPKQIAILAIKDEKILELWARNNQNWKKVKNITITAASGKAGPKLWEGDRQVPEGVYKILGLNPKSSFHLSMKLNYPNDFDSYWAEQEGRTSPGSDIFIHGKAVSIGCIAIGDEAIEELYFTVQKVGIKNVIVVIAPSDPRKKELIPDKNWPAWVGELYKNIGTEFLLIAGK